MTEDITIINEWKNALDYESKYHKYVDKTQIWQYKQNNPELVVEDILLVLRSHGMLDADDTGKEQELRDIFYSILLQRGVNKWLFIRRLLIRLKKVYCARLGTLESEMDDMRERFKSGDSERSDYRNYLIKKGEMRAYNTLRHDLKTLCMGPRWVIWNYKEPGMFDTIGMKPSYRKSFKALFDKLWNFRFEK